MEIEFDGTAEPPPGTLVSSEGIGYYGILHEDGTQIWVQIPLNDRSRHFNWNELSFPCNLKSVALNRGELERWLSFFPSNVDGGNLDWDDEERVTPGGNHYTISEDTSMQKIIDRSVDYEQGKIAGWVGTRAYLESLEEANESDILSRLLGWLDGKIGYQS